MMHRSSLLTFFLITLFAINIGGVYASAQDVGSDQVELKRCWSYVDERFFTAVTVDETTAYVATNEAQIVAISLLTGQKVWSAELGGALSSNLEVSAFGLHLITQPAAVDGQPKPALLWRLSKETGTPAKPLETSDGQHTLRSINGRLLAVSSSGKVNSIDAKELIAVWNRVPTGSITGEPFISADLIAFATSDGKLIRMSTLTGEIVSTEQLASKPTRVYASREGIVFGNERGELVSVEPKWRFRTGASVNGVSSLRDALLVTSLDNFVYLINRGSGDVIWKRRLEGRVAGTVAVDEDKLAVFSLGADNGYLLETKKGRAISLAPFGVQADSVVVGPQNPLGPIALVNGDVVAFSKNGCKLKGGTEFSAPPVVK